VTSANSGLQKLSQPGWAPPLARIKLIKCASNNENTITRTNTIIQRFVAGMVLSLRNVFLLPLQLTHVVLLLFFQSTNFQCTNVGGGG
jgi:hypothetical protein